jgi:DNA repair protein RadC
MAIQTRATRRFITKAPTAGESRSTYDVSKQFLTGLSDEEIVSFLEKFAARRLRRGRKLKNPDDAREFAKIWLGLIEHEVFAVIFLDTQQRIISCDELFQGTLNQCVVYKREVVKAALLHNAFSVIFLHNHPSGVAGISDSDRKLTEQLIAALNMVDVRVLDHIIVAGAESTSFAERGLI